MSSASSQPLLDSLLYVHATFLLGSAKLEHCSRSGHTSAEQRGRINSLNLLSTLLMQPRTPLGFFVTRAPFWFHLDPWPFTVKLLPPVCPPAGTGTWDCSFPGAGLCILLVEPFSRCSSMSRLYLLYSW